MKISTKITTRQTLRSVSLTLIVVLTLVGCKRNVENEVQIDPNELTFTAVYPKPIDKLGVFAPSRAEVSLDEFVAGSSVGLYTQIKSESDKGSVTVLKSNSLYRYDQPIWRASSKEEKLMYHDSKPIYVFGFYPHSSMAGSSTTVSPGSSNVEFTLRTDQSDAEATQLSDLMWVGAKNEGNGYLRQRQPISLTFQHMLCKVSFYVKLIDSRPDVSNSPKAYLRGISATGAQITDKAILKALDGTLLMTYKPNHQGTVSWTSDAGTELLIGGPAVYVADLLLLPFVAVENQNSFKYAVYYPEADFTQNFTATIPKYDPAATGTSANKLCFESNKHNKVTLTIDVSSIYMTISTEIAPWGIGPETELPAEPE